jgi:co-chaperonin GroES (HSP10)
MTLAANTNALESSGIRLDPKRYEVIQEDEHLRPLRDQIIVKPLAWEPSRVIEIAGNKRKALRGVIVAAGPGCYPKRYNKDRSKSWDSTQFRPLQVKVGDVVELGGLEIEGYSFPQILIGNELHVIAREEDVAGVVL